MAYNEVESYVCRRCCPHLGDREVFCERPDGAKRCTRCANVHRPCVPAQDDPYVRSVLEVRRDLRVKHSAGTIQPEDGRRLRLAMKALIKNDRDTQTAKAMATNARKRQVGDAARMARIAPMPSSSSSSHPVSSGKKRKRASDAGEDSAPDSQEPAFTVPSSSLGQLGSEQLMALVMNQAQQCDRAAYAMLKAIGRDPASIVEFAEPNAISSAERIAVAGAEMEEEEEEEEEEAEEHSPSQHVNHGAEQSMDAVVIRGSQRGANNHLRDDGEDDLDHNFDDKAEDGSEYVAVNNDESVDDPIEDHVEEEEEDDSNDEENEPRHESPELLDGEPESNYGNHRRRNRSKAAFDAVTTGDEEDEEWDAESTPAPENKQRISPVIYGSPTKRTTGAAARYDYVYSDSDGSDESRHGSPEL